MLVSITNRIHRDRFRFWPQVVIKSDHKGSRSSRKIKAIWLRKNTNGGHKSLNALLKCFPVPTLFNDGRQLVGVLELCKYFCLFWFLSSNIWAVQGVTYVKFNENGYKTDCIIVPNLISFFCDYYFLVTLFKVAFFFIRSLLYGSRFRPTWNLDSLLGLS